MANARDPDSRLLRTLRAGQPLNGLGLDTLNLAVRLDGLRAAGYVINDTADGHRLAAAPARLIADDLCASLTENNTGIGREILVFEETDSTNDLAARAGQDGVPGGLVIFAESQRAGRGRLGRKWTAPPHRALLFSVLLRPAPTPPERWPELTFCAALAVAETAETLTGQSARIKWPNDVLVNGRKIAGILLERHESQPTGFVVVGIGLNVLQAKEDFPPELCERAGSLAMFAPSSSKSLERRQAAVLVLERLEAIVRRWPSEYPAIMDACIQRGCVRPMEE